MNRGSLSFLTCFYIPICMMRRRGKEKKGTIANLENSTSSIQQLHYIRHYHFKIYRQLHKLRGHTEPIFEGNSKPYACIVDVLEAEEQ